MKAISIKNLHKRFGRDSILKGLSLEVEEGGIFGIVGRSGAGKTTLIHCLTGLERPTEGEVIVASQSISHLSGAELCRARQQIGMVFQQFYLFSSRTALENICYPLEISGRTGNPEELLALVGLEGKGDLYPSALSGGQRQRVAIARALALNPKILLCDEPTSALDPETTDSILKLLLKLNQKLGVTIIVITHEMEVVRQICHRVAVLEKGEIIEEGRTLDLFAHPKHPVTKRLLTRLTHDIPIHFHPTDPNAELIRLCFPTGLAEKGLISKMLKQFPVDVNILMGAIDILLEGQIGNLMIEISGKKEDREKALKFLQDCGVSIEEVNL